VLRLFKMRGFAKFARSEGITDEALAKAIRRAEQGVIDAELGSGLVKLRIARPGRGKSGGYRTLLAYRSGVRAVFLFGFPKNERENISRNQLSDLKAVARDILKRADRGLTADVEAG
jgi:hypothetical protein